VTVTTRAHVIGSVISQDVTDATLAAAKAGDRDAGASLLAGLEDRFRRLARRTAVQAIGDDKVGLRDAYMEDFIQDAHLAAWECLLKCQDETLDGFYAYAYATAERELAAAARDMKNGTNDDPDGKKLFGLLVKHFRELDVRHTMGHADYLTLAESAAQDLTFLNAFRGGVYGGRRGSLSADRAHAARLAYQGAVSTNTPTGDDGATIADALAGLAVVEDTADVAVVGYRPIQWVQAVRALEDTVTVPRDADDRETLFLALDRFRAGTVTAEDLDLVESLPCRNADFGTAVAMLRAIYTQREEGPVESTAEKSADAALGRGSIALNVQRAALELATDAAVVRALVRRVLATMSQRQAYILAATFGFMGKFKDDAAVARAMKASGIADIDGPRVRKDRDKARAAFTKKWADLVAKNGSERAALEVAAAKTGVDLAEALAED
jgi:hypothetical protein